MEHNLNIYGIGLRYILCLFAGMAGGLLHSSSALFGSILLALSVVFFLEAILAFSPLVHFMGKNNSKEAIDDFK